MPLWYRNLFSVSRHLNITQLEKPARLVGIVWLLSAPGKPLEFAL